MLQLSELDQQAQTEQIVDWQYWSQQRAHVENLWLWRMHFEEAFLQNDIQEMERLWLKVCPLQSNPWLVFIQAGQGGYEAQSWVQTLASIYIKWCEKYSIEYEIVDNDNAEMALRMKGRHFDLFLAQVGLHRFVRSSPFDRQERTHTSFVHVSVLIENEMPIGVFEEKDVEVTTMLSTGAGGQHVNKTESAVRMKHVPTNICVVCRGSRSQHQNKKTAWAMLEQKVQQHLSPALKKITTEQRAWNYDLHRNTVKEVTTGKTFEAISYLGGQIDPVEIGA